MGIGGGVCGGGGGAGGTGNGAATAAVGGGGSGAVALSHYGGAVCSCALRFAVADCGVAVQMIGWTAEKEFREAGSTGGQTISKYVMGKGTPLKKNQ